MQRAENQARLGLAEQAYPYDGQGTEDDPFLVDFKKDEPENPQNWSTIRKWFITIIVTLSVFAVTLTSSAYSESVDEVVEDFKISDEVFIIGVSLFVLGFAVGPPFWGPLVSTHLDSRVTADNFSHSKIIALDHQRGLP